MRLNRSLAVLGLSLACGLGMMALPSSQQEQLANRVRTGLWTTSQLLFSRVIRYAHNEEKSRFLLEQNAQLALENMHLREAGEENARLRRALEFRQVEGPGELIAAEVIGRDPDQLYDSLVINAGEDRGVEPDWPVVTAEGLVGHVASVDASSSVVQLLMRTPVSAIVQDGRAQGVVSWVRGNLFRLQFVEASSSIKEGSWVVSSGIGGRYPKGIPIGAVTEVRARGRDPLFQEVFLTAAVDFLRLEEVFVLPPAGHALR
jgi:rod shape-determining protein MreC